MDRTRFRLESERGASSAEYAMMAAGVAALIALAVFGVGAATSGQFTDTCESFGAASSGTFGCG